MGRIDWLARLAILLALAGCGGGGDGTTTAVNLDSAKLRSMGDMYGMYLREHKNQPPPDEQTFRTYLGTKQEVLNRVGISIDQMFVSPQSSEPLVWVYGKKRPSGSIQYIAYEKMPVDGKRLVIAPRGIYEEMDDARFRTVFPNAK